MPTAATFFSGIGGACHGLKLAGYAVVFGTDLWEFVEPIWRSFNPRADFWLGDFLELKREQVPDTDLYWFSPPCQDFSLANPKRGSDIQYNFQIAEQIYHLVKGKLPATVIIENVPNFQKSECYRQLLYWLVMLGYYPRVKVVDAADFDVPQHRKRIILVFTRIKPIANICGEIGRTIGWDDCLREDFPQLNDQSELVFQLKTRRKAGLPSPTITGAVGRARAYIELNNGEPKIKLSNKHLAKLQTLPEFDWGESQKFSIAIGNAVPPLLIKNLLF